MVCNRHGSARIPTVTSSCVQGAWSHIGTYTHGADRETATTTTTTTTVSPPTPPVANERVLDKRWRNQTVSRVTLTPWDKHTRTHAQSGPYPSSPPVQQLHDVRDVAVPINDTHTHTRLTMLTGCWPQNGVIINIIIITATTTFVYRFIP